MIGGLFSKSSNFQQRFDEKVPKTGHIRGPVAPWASLVLILEGRWRDVTTKGFLT